VKASPPPPPPAAPRRLLTLLAGAERRPTTATQRFIDEFHTDVDLLNCLRPSVEPKVLSPPPESQPSHRRLSASAAVQAVQDQHAWLRHTPRGPGSLPSRGMTAHHWPPSPALALCVCVCVRSQKGDDHSAQRATSQQKSQSPLQQPHVVCVFPKQLGLSSSQAAVR